MRELRKLILQRKYQLSCVTLGPFTAPRPTESRAYSVIRRLSSLGKAGVGQEELAGGGIASGGLRHSSPTAKPRRSGSAQSSVACVFRFRTAVLEFWDSDSLANNIHRPLYSRLVVLVPPYGGKSSCPNLKGVRPLVTRPCNPPLLSGARPNEGQSTHPLHRKV